MGDASSRQKHPVHNQARIKTPPPPRPLLILNPPPPLLQASPHTQPPPPSWTRPASSTELDMRRVGNRIQQIGGRTHHVAFGSNSPDIYSTGIMFPLPWQMRPMFGTSLFLCFYRHPSHLRRGSPSLLPCVGHGPLFSQASSHPSPQAAAFSRDEGEMGKMTCWVAQAHMQRNHENNARLALPSQKGPMAS